jgi:methionyl aminopeptidase
MPDRKKGYRGGRKYSKRKSPVKRSSAKKGMIKDERDIELLREGGKRLSQAVNELADMLQPGLTTDAINDRALELAHKADARPSFLHYTPYGVSYPYPAAVCVSINEAVVHGIPTDPVFTINEGDVVTVDMGFEYKGRFTDMAITRTVGKVSREAQELVAATEYALELGIRAAVPGNTIGDIGYAIEQYARELNLSIADGLAGHGVGYAVHEDPFVPNKGVRGHGDVLEPGMVLAIEPMFMLGGSRVEFLSDEYTAVTYDRKKSAHFEHTVAITEAEAEVFTK